MTRIIHLSDLHFGTETDHVLTDLKNDIRKSAADLVAVSGDFTQIASHEEFKEARNFLDSLGIPFMAVPGNHDVPRYDLWERFFDPFRKYKKHIDPDLCPVFENDMVYIQGLNSARRALLHWNWANGAINKAQCEMVAKSMEKAGMRWRICMFHHPVQKVPEMPLDVTVFGRKNIMETIEKSHVDLVLTGHVHHASLMIKGHEEHQTVYLSASTALSSRLRGQENGYNVIDFDDGDMNIRVFKHNGRDFALYSEQDFAKT